jgi:hypothetical protein
MIATKRLIEWLDTLPEGSGVSIDDGGLTLVCNDVPGAYLEVGGVPEEEPVADYIAYLTVKFKTPFDRDQLDFGALNIAHSSGRSYVLDVDRSWTGDADLSVELRATVDLETFPMGGDYPYSLTREDIDSGDIKAAFFVGGEDPAEVESITYSLVDYAGQAVASGLVAEEEK